MRLFLAIQLPHPFRNHLTRLQSTLKPLATSASFIRPENLHLTLKFLGQVPDTHLKPLADSLTQIPPSTPIDLTADHLVCFPTHGPIRIIAAALTTPPSLLQLVSHIESTCHSLGHPLEPRPYTAHITLARARNPLPTPLRKTLADSTRPLFPGPAFGPAEFVLMQSDLTPKGPIYTPAARFTI